MAGLPPGAGAPLFAGLPADAALGAAPDAGVGAGVVVVLGESPLKTIGKPLGDEPKITTFELFDSASFKVASIPRIFK